MSRTTTLGDSSQVVIEIQESGAIVIGFPTSDDTIIVGSICKLANTGIVSAVAAVTDAPIGVCVSAYKGNDAGNVRIMTPFVAIEYCETDGTVAIGGQVAASGMNTAGDRQKMKAAVATNWVSGIALEGATTGNIIRVGILRTPFLKA
jgi:hypothetical protein